ncbi:hypothetical protein [Streptomyces huiliensis]|uniref:hypothetical protein n=1 Tax=Streptomyces huiliensis TaxID=2876027 RepID=UPI001CBAB029|nr:hypothetical protein [Streptomyces huiliensis]MBZ4319395.1 hypothetical protein [Streptomyces huiliensis]
MRRRLMAARPSGGPALDGILDELRACQPGPELAEQRHQFLDLDPDLVRDDYTRPAALTSTEEAT